MVLILQKFVGLLQLVIFTLSNTKEQKPSSGQFVWIWPHTPIKSSLNFYCKQLVLVAREPFIQEITWKGATAGYFSVFSHPPSPSSWQSRSAGVCRVGVPVSRVLWALSRGGGHSPRAIFCPVLREPGSCCRRSARSQLCPHTPVFATGWAWDPASVSTATFHRGMKCHVGVVASTQTALLVKQFCTIASFQQPNTSFPQIWKQNFRL